MLKSILRDASASTAVEFALIAPIFAYFLLMIAQVGLYFYYSATLQSAADAAVRQILVGNVANPSAGSTLTQTQFINNILCHAAPTLQCADFVVNLIQAPADFYSLTNKAANPNLPLGYQLTGLNNPPMNNSQTSYCIGGDGAIVVAQIFYPMPVVGIPAFAGAAQFNGQSVIWIQANDVFKNEPFSTSYQGC